MPALKPRNAGIWFLQLTGRCVEPGDSTSRVWDDSRFLNSLVRGESPCSAGTYENSPQILTAGSRRTQALRPGGMVELHTVPKIRAICVKSL